MTPPPVPVARAVAEVEARLAELWAGEAGERLVAQARTLNLLVVAGASLSEKTEFVVDEIVNDLLARAFVVRSAPGQTQGSAAAQVNTVRCGGPDGPVLVPRTDLWLGPGVESLARSVVAPLLGARLRTVVHVASGADRTLARALLPLADEVMTDAGEDPDLARWTAGVTDRNLVDLTFLRGLRWRELIARSFDAPETCPAVWAVRRVTVHQLGSASGGTVEGELLVAWLGSRLGWQVEREAVLDRSGREVRLELQKVEVPGVRAGSLQRVELVAEAPSGKLESLITRDPGSGRLGWTLTVPAIGSRQLKIAAALPSSYHLASRALGSMHREPAALDTFRWLERWREQATGGG